MLLCAAVLCFIRFGRFKDTNTCSLTVCIKHTLNKFLGNVWVKQNYEGCYSTWHPFCFQGNLMYDHISLIEPKKCIWHLLVSICYSFFCQVHAALFHYKLQIFVLKNWWCQILGTNRKQVSHSTFLQNVN